MDKMALLQDSRRVIMPILEWLGKNEAVKSADKIPYKLLKVNEELSYGDKTENMIIKGDNLEALKALLPYYKGQVKCIYIDPPYNTGSAFDKYNDNLEHSTWLSLMYPRLELLRELLSEDGIIYVQIDSNEHCYLKVLMDEIFGRNNFIADIVWRKKSGGGQTSEYFIVEHEYIFAYKKNKWSIIDEEEFYNIKDFNKKINNKSAKMMKLEKWGNSARREDRPSLYYAIKTPDGEEFFPKAPNGDDGRWRKKPETLDSEHIYWEKRNGEWKPYEVIYFDEVNKKTIKTRSIWLDYGNNTEAANEMTALFNVKDFDTPKPEKLIEKILKISTNENDLILDSFLGSGTTCAVAQKMGRRYIGIEMGEHAITHCVPRMKAVIDGEQGGISKAINWNGGGGYTFYDLGETIFDENGNINKQVDFKTLAGHVWFSETKTPLTNYEKSPLLGIYNGIAYYLLFNGILGDKKPDGGNVLTQKVLDSLPKFDGKKIIYGEASRMSLDKLKANNIVFKQTPYEIKAR